MAGPLFIDRDTFPKYLAKPYSDVATIYGDMSRLVVALLASTEPQELQAMYSRLGWGGSANVRALHDAATSWMDQHRPQRDSDSQDAE